MNTMNTRTYVKINLNELFNVSHNQKIICKNCGTVYDPENIFVSEEEDISDKYDYTSNQLFEKCPNCGDKETMIIVDEKLSSIVSRMNRNGLHTIYSCQGGIVQWDEDNIVYDQPYILFFFDQSVDKSDIIKALYSLRPNCIELAFRHDYTSVYENKDHILNTGNHDEVVYISGESILYESDEYFDSNNYNLIYDQSEYSKNEDEESFIEKILGIQLNAIIKYMNDVCDAIENKTSEA